MASNGKTQRVRTIDSHSIAGGGPEPLELMKLSTRTWLLIYILRFPFRHRVFGFILLTTLATIIFEDFSLTSILLNLAAALLIGTIGLYIYTYSRYAYAPNLARLTTAIRRRWLVHRRWPRAIRSAGFDTQRKLTRVRYTPNGMVGEFLCIDGRNSEDLMAGAQDIAGVLKAHEVKVDANVPYKAHVSIVWGDPTERILLPEDMSSIQTPDSDRVAFALDADHQPLELSITTSILIVGESESGKSNCFWSILNALNEKDLPYKLWVIDPAGGVELNELETSPNTLAYGGKPGDASHIIENCYNALEQRLATLKSSRTRKYKISQDTPLNILVIDELLLLSTHGHDSSLGHIISSGRKAGFIVIGLSQLSQIDSIGRIRDLFPQRICHATKSQEMTDAALGPGAEASGARCSSISKRTPGVGYYFSLQSRLYMRFRTPLISDHNTKIIALGNLIQRTITDDPIKSKFTKRLGRRRTSLYRYYGEYQGEMGRLLYVGIAYEPKQRWHQHCEDPKEPWCPHDVDSSLTEIEWFGSRQEAKQAETEAIQSERPVYNKQERVDYVPS